MGRILTRTAKSTNEPVTVEEVKNHARINTTADDTLLAGYISAARAYAENLTKRELTTAIRVLYLDEFPGDDDEIELPRPPLSSNSSDVTIGYVDSSGSTQTFASTSYTVDSDSEPGRVYCVYDGEWPDTRDVRRAIGIAYHCGYTTATIPESVKTWIKVRVADMYEHRESIGDARTYKLPHSHVDGMLDDILVLTASGYST